MTGPPDPVEFLTTARPKQPYPGLRPFEAEEWSIFFGRERMIDDVIERLATHRLVLIHGASGTGKSSLVRAGVLPKLARQHLRHGAHWLNCSIRPSRGPLWNLAKELARLEGPEDDMVRVGNIMRQFSQEGATLRSIVGSLDRVKGRRLCILVDQFEELFRFAKETSHEEAELFVDLLARQIDDDDVDPAHAEDENYRKSRKTDDQSAAQVHVVITMRSEFLGECTRFEGLAEAINRTQYLVPRLDRDDLLRAICRPAMLYGGQVRLELAERLIADAAGRDDELPLIQHGLMLLWADAASVASAGQIVLDAAPLEKAGGLASLLSRHADAIIDKAAPDIPRRKAVEQLFCALTDINAEGQAIRRSQEFRDLVAVAGVDVDTLRTMIDALRAEGASFLTPYSPAAIEDGTIIDISHEALIRCWQRIADPSTGWLKQEFDDGLLWRSLAFEAKRFEKNRKHILPAATIEERQKWLAAQSERWCERYGGNWASVCELVNASVLARDRSLRLRKTAVFAAICAMFILTAGAVVFSIFAYQARNAAVRQRAEVLRGVDTLVAKLSVGSTDVDKQALSAALSSIAAGAAQGDERLQSALNLLKENKVAEAETLLRAIAEEKAARAQNDRRDAAVAWRNLATSVGLSDPKRALDAYKKAAELDPDDIESTFWIGRIQIDRGFLDEAEMQFQRVLSLPTTDDQATYKLQADLGLGDIRVQRGDLSGALDFYKQAFAVASRRSVSDPSNNTRQRDLADATIRMGNVETAEGNLPAALASYQAGLAIAERLVKSDPGNAGWQRDLSVYDKVGDAQVAQGNLPAALTSYQASLAIRERLAKSDAGNAGWQRDLSVSHGRVGDVQVAQGNLPAALISYQASLAIAERLVKSDPGNASWQRDLSVSYGRVGDVQVAQANLSAALTSYQAGLAIAERLVKSDPGNAGSQRDLSVSYDKVGDLEVAQGSLSAALTSYQASLAIRERLAKSDPGNAGWQRDLSVSHGRVGDVQVAQGNLPAALISYQASLAIAERLAKADPGNADWQRDLSVSYGRVGDVQVVQSNLPAALTSYQAGLAIAERLAKSDPGNASWQRDLAVSYAKIADVYLKSKQISQAQEALAAGRAILAPLTAQHPEFARWKQDLDWFDRQIAALKK
jgi:tetratricopeptide (TPR) repeat protein